MPDTDRLRDLLEVSRGPVVDALAEVVDIPRETVVDVLLEVGIDPELPAAAVTDAEVGRVRGRLVAGPRPRRRG